MNYISAAEAAEKWGVGLRQVQRLLAFDRIPNVKKHGRSWLIPADSEKPGDLRTEKKSPGQSLFSGLNRILSLTVTPWPAHDPDAILNTVSEERLRLQFECELAYLRGDFKQVIDCFRRTGGDDLAKLRACSITIGAAISTGDYPLYLEVESFLKYIARENHDDRLTVFTELCLATAHTGAFAPNMAPEWLKNGDFTLLHPLARPDAAYKRAKYFQCLGKYETMLTVAQTALNFCAPERGMTFHALYFRLICAAAGYALERADEAKHWLLDAMNIALPHGFITPFAESALAFGGLLEQCLEQYFPAYYQAVTEQWKSTFANWLTFHNQFTQDNITLILSLRDYELASLAARGVPYAKIAKQHNISVGHLQNIMQDIFAALLITKKNELRKFII